MAPLVRDQIQRQASILWRCVLGEDGYAATLMKRRDLAVGTLLKSVDSDVISRIVRLCEPARGSCPEEVKAQVLILGTHELWRYTEKRAPELRDRVMLMVLPKEFDFQYRAQLDHYEVGEILALCINAANDSGASPSDELVGLQES
ncbi:hypothetical protein [Hahella ganghwensis]|uniref:hypothetical protein n=1 Tax=Hahella ganghwensis TaxID=286420 RepID=UPI00052792E0|nr:hypothetical protein [Hahella ganghwensis]